MTDQHAENTVRQPSNLRLPLTRVSLHSTRGERMISHHILEHVCRSPSQIFESKQHRRHRRLSLHMLCARPETLQQLGSSRIIQVDNKND